MAKPCRRQVNRVHWEILQFGARLTKSRSDEVNGPMNNPSSETNAGNVTLRDSGGKPFRPLRIWPPVLLVALMLAARFGPALAEGGAGRYWMMAVFGPLLCC